MPHKRKVYHLLSLVIALGMALAPVRSLAAPSIRVPDSPQVPPPPARALLREVHASRSVSQTTVEVVDASSPLLSTWGLDFDDAWGPSPAEAHPMLGPEWPDQAAGQEKAASDLRPALPPAASLLPDLSPPQLSTFVSGTIGTNTTWITAESPYVVDGNLSINPGVMLTIEPGVVVKFAANTSLTVQGQLLASGSNGGDIYFTSLKDDTVAGDTNGDGSSTVPDRGDWGWITLYNGGEASLDHVVVRYGGSGGYGNIRFMYYSMLTMRHSTVGESAGEGISVGQSGYGHNPAATIVDSVIEHNTKTGISARNTVLRVENCTIRNNGAAGVSLYTVGALRPTAIMSNTIENNGGVAVWLYYDFYDYGTGLPTLSGNTFTGNAMNGLALSGAIAGDLTLSKHPDLGNTYVIGGGTKVMAGATLTVRPGVVLKFDPASWFTVYGRLLAQGTVEEAIHFTSLKDDTVGGDTNGDGSATAPAPGDWSGWGLTEGGQATLAYAVVRYAAWPAAIGASGNSVLAMSHSTVSQNAYYGVSLSNNAPTTKIVDSIIADNWIGIRASNAALDVENCAIQDNGNVGIQSEADSIVAIEGTSITGNASFGIENTFPTQSVRAVDNWWGHPSGPYHPLNPEGLGDPVSDGVAHEPWRVSPAFRQSTPLILGQPVTDSIEPFEFRDYHLVTPAGSALRVKVVPLSGSEALWAYSRLGKLPLWTRYNRRVQQETMQGTYELLISPTQQGAYYLSVYGRDVADTGGSYQIVVDAVQGPYLSDVLPRSAGNAAQMTLSLSGLGFVDGMQVELRHASLPTLTADNVTLLSPTSLWAHFDLDGAASGIYDVTAVWPDYTERTLESAFEVVTGEGGHLEAQLEAPEFVRPGRQYILWLEYANTGDAELLAPLFVISSTDNLPMRLSVEEAYQEGPVQALGLNPEGYIGRLGPGMSSRIPIYFSVPPETGAHEMLDFDLSVMISDTQPIDWDQVEAEIKPADVDPEVWDVVWPILTAQLGDTWGDYRQALADDAGYLSTLGRRVYGVGDLFGFEVRKALGMNPRTILAGQVDAYAPAPGTSLQFGRIFPGSLEGRFYLGPLGRGWSHSYDIWLEEQSDGGVRIHWPGSFSRLFASNGDGTYTPSPGDYGTLSREGEIYTLVEKTGTRYRFRLDGQLDYVEDLNGNRITASYNGSGRLIGISHSNGESFALEYNAQGCIWHLTDHVGRVTEYNYDASGEHLLTVTVPGGRLTTYAYNPAGGQAGDHALLSVAYPGGTYQYYAYDTQGRLTEEHRDGGAEPILYAYDAMGRIQATDADGHTTVVSPDEYGRPARVRDALGRELDQEYSAGFTLSRLTDPAGQDYEFTYDLLGNVIGSQDPLGYELTLAYNTRFSQLASLEDARGNKSTFAYDAAGNLTTLTYPDGSSETFAYDTAGNPTTYSSRGGVEITYTYDARGQLLRRDYPDGSWAAYTYDAAGNLTTATDASGTISMTYDADTDLLTRIEYPTGQWFEYSNNDAGQRTQRRDQDGHELNYEYDAAGRLSRLYNESATDIITYEYDANGRLSRESKGNGTYAVYEYDAAGQVLSLVNYAPDDSVQSRFDYTYDANGNRTSMTTLEGTTTYEYDAINQLVGVTYPDGREVTYEYDAAGNRLAATDDGTETFYTTNNLNQYTQVGAATYTYDANGSMTSETDFNGTTTYEYDVENRLIRVTTPLSGTWEYTYDALGNRAAVEHDGVVTRYVHDPIGLVDVAAEYDGSGGLVAQYVHGLGLVERIDAAGNAAYYAFDATGHTRQVTDEIGAVANTYDYTPFGIPLHADEMVSNPFLYVGRFGVMEDDNALHFMRTRYYSGVLGRFMSVDRARFAEGGSNLYTYVYNSPIGLIDPQGYSFLRTWGPFIVKTTGGVISAIGVIGLAFGVASTPVGWLLVLGGALVTGIGVGWEMLEGGHGLAIKKEQPWEADWTLENYEQYLERECSPPGGSLPKESGDKKHSETRTSDDPNEKAGPEGLGPERVVDVGDELAYTIYFENVITATAPAQEVFVTDYLDPNLDWDTFRLTEIAFGDQEIAVPGDESHFYTQETVPDYRDTMTKSWWVDVTAEIDYQTGRARWTLRTLDPETGDLPLDALAGFLPPNDDSGRGEGHVSFAIRPRADITLGTRISNTASIVFDVNEAIETNEVWNTVQAFTTRELPIAQGWNLISWPLVPATENLTDTLESWCSTCDQAWTYDAWDEAEAWKHWPGDLEQADEAMGLWLHVTDTVTLTLVGWQAASPTIDLRTGWNLVGYPSQTARPVAETLSSITGKYTLIRTFDVTDVADPWKEHDVSAPPYANDLVVMEPGRGYWLYVSEDCTWSVEP